MKSNVQQASEPMNNFFDTDLAQADADIFSAIQEELHRHAGQSRFAFVLNPVLDGSLPSEPPNYVFTAGIKGTFL